MHTQIWMVEQWREIHGQTVPIRSVVRAKTRRRARGRAEAACVAAMQQLAGEPGKPKGPAHELYPIGYE